MSPAKLFDAGLVADPICRACGVKAGTLLHRLGACAARTETLDSHCPKGLAKEASARTADPLFAEGIPLRPVMPGPPAPQEHWIGSIPTDGAVASGEAYTDGALRGTLPKTRRAGWAFVVRQAGSQVWGKFGVCSESFTTVLRSELRALAEILRIASGPLTVHVDNSQVVDGVALGEEWCVNAKRDGADIWREIWGMLRELHGIKVVKVKAHLKYEHVREGRIKFEHWCGNGMADKSAKAGCDAACASSMMDWPQECWKRAHQWYKWVVVVASDWIEDTAMSGPILQRPTKDREFQARRSPTRAHSVQARKHEMWANEATAWCRQCGKSEPWSGGPVRTAALRRPCRGNMAHRCGATTSADSHNPSTFDDGCISLATLHAQFARRIYEDVRPAQCRQLEMTRPEPVPQEADVSDMVQEYPPSVASEEEEDVFGHQRLGMDDPFILGSGNPPSRSESRRQEMDNEPLTFVGPPAMDAEPGQQSSSPPELEDVDGEQVGQVHASHRMRRTINVVWCTDCGRSAIQRIGVGLLRPCRGVATGAYPARIARIRAGRHPVTGSPLRQDSVLHLVP